jgi:hypothetical protein
MRLRRRFAAVLGWLLLLPAFARTGGRSRHSAQRWLSQSALVRKELEDGHA